MHMQFLNIQNSGMGEKSKSIRKKMLIKAIQTRYTQIRTDTDRYTQILTIADNIRFITDIYERPICSTRVL